MASLIQDVWLGFSPRLRARRLAPWEEAPVRLLFLLDAGWSLDEPRVASLLETLAESLEVLAWEPRDGDGASLLDDTRAEARDGGRRWGEKPLVLGGYGLGAWAALAAADTTGVSAAVALAPSLASAGPVTPEPSALRRALASALGRPPGAAPALVLEGRDRPAAEARVVREWLAREPTAALLTVPGGDEAVLGAPWVAAVRAWALARAGTAR